LPRAIHRGSRSARGYGEERPSVSAERPWFQQPLRPLRSAWPVAVAREAKRLLALYDEFEDWLRNGRQAERDARVSGWSRAEHVEHVLAANEQILGRVLRLLGGESLEAFEHAGPSAAGWIVLLSARIPRGRGSAPQSVWPTESPEPAALRRRLDAARALVSAARGAWERAPRHALRYRHLVFGDYDAAQWIRYARIHALHHARIGRLLACDAPGTIPAEASAPVFSHVPGGASRGAGREEGSAGREAGGAGRAGRP
jgi:hypothetical protein